MKKNLLCDVLDVAEGRHAPAGSAAEYMREALAWASRSAEPGELPEVALARLIVQGNPVINVCYLAAERAAQQESNQ